MSLSTLNHSSQSSSKKRCARGITWKALRREILHAVLYSKTWAGIGEDIFSRVREYYADYSRLPIGMLRAILGKIAHDDNKGYEHCFLNLYYDEKVPDLPKYDKVRGEMVEVQEGEPAGDPSHRRKRRNRWQIRIVFAVLGTQPHWSRGKQFRLYCARRYDVMHWSNLPSTMDTYAGRPSAETTFTREGNLHELIKQDAFLHHLRDLIFTCIYRLKRTRFCERIVMRPRSEAKKKQYKSFCGYTVHPGCDTCPYCFESDFKDFVTGIC